MESRGVVSRENGGGGGGLSVAPGAVAGLEDGGGGGGGSDVAESCAVANREDGGGGHTVDVAPRESRAVGGGAGLSVAGGTRLYRSTIGDNAPLQR